MNEMTTGVLLDHTKVGNKRMTLPQAHFHLEVLDVSATSSPKWFVGEVELTHRSCSDHIPTEVRSRLSRRWNGIFMVELGNSKSTSKTDLTDL